MTTTQITNTQIAKALTLLEDAGVISDDRSSDILSDWLVNQGITKEQFYETV